MSYVYIYIYVYYFHDTFFLAASHTSRNINKHQTQYMLSFIMILFFNLLSHVRREKVIPKRKENDVCFKINKEFICG